MCTRKMLAGLIMALIPFFGFAQGKGQGQGGGKHRGQGHGKPPAKGRQVHPDAGRKTIYRGNPNVYRGQPVRVRTQQPHGYYGYGRRGGPPPWAHAHGYRAQQHVYFPDYRFFYDPYRGGYAYWQNNGWAFSPYAPGFMAGIDLGKARIQVLTGLPLTARPELYYGRYSRLYPARSVNMIVPVPPQQVYGYPGHRRIAGPPPWARAHGYRARQHVYFPDYRFFYDPYRGGYSYWRNNGWVFSPTVPGYMANIDLGKVRIQLMNTVPLSTHPELYYNRYSTLYPARRVNVIVPIPGR